MNKRRFSPLFVRIVYKHPQLVLDTSDREWDGEHFTVGRTEGNDIHVPLTQGLALGGKRSLQFVRRDDGALSVSHNGSNHHIIVNFADGTSKRLDRPGTCLISVGDRIDLHAVQGPLMLSFVLEEVTGLSPNLAPPTMQKSDRSETPYPPLLVRFVYKATYDKVDPFDRLWKGERFTVGQGSMNDIRVPERPVSSFGADTSLHFVRAERGEVRAYHQGADHDIVVRASDGTKHVLQAGDDLPIQLGDHVDLYAEQGHLRLSLSVAQPGPDGRAVPKPARKKHVFVRLMQTDERLKFDHADLLVSGDHFSVGHGEHNDIVVPAATGLALAGASSVQVTRTHGGLLSVQHLGSENGGRFFCHKIVVQTKDGAPHTLGFAEDLKRPLDSGDVVELLASSGALVLAFQVYEKSPWDTEGPIWAKFRAGDRDIVVQRVGSEQQSLYQVRVDDVQVPCMSRYTKTVGDYPKLNQELRSISDGPYVALPPMPTTSAASRREVTGPLEVKRRDDGWEAEATLRFTVETPDTIAYNHDRVHFHFSPAFDRVQVTVDRYIDLSR